MKTEMELRMEMELNLQVNRSHQVAQMHQYRSVSSTNKGDTLERLFHCSIFVLPYEHIEATICSI